MPPFAIVRKSDKNVRMISKPSHQNCSEMFGQPKYNYVARDGALPSAWAGSETWVEFSIPQDIGVIAGMTAQFDMRSSGGASKVLPTSLWVDRISISLGGEHLETIYADDIHHESIGFKSNQEFDQINEVVNMSSHYDLSGLAIPAASTRYYLPLENCLTSARVYVKGFTPKFKVKVYFASSILVSGGGTLTLDDLQLIVEEADLSPSEKASVANAHRSVVDYGLVVRNRQSEVVSGGLSTSADTTVYLRSLTHKSAGLLVYSQVAAPAAADRLKRHSLKDIQLMSQTNSKLTELLKGGFLKAFTWSNHINSPFTTHSSITTATTATCAALSGDPETPLITVVSTNSDGSQPAGANLYLVPFSNSFQDSVMKGCDFGSMKLTSQEKLLVKSTATQADATLVVVSYDHGHLICANGAPTISWE